MSQPVPQPEPTADGTEVVADVPTLSVVPADRSDQHDAGTERYLDAVDRMLTAALADLASEWSAGAGSPHDLMAGADLPQLLTDLIGAGGKRIRPTMAYLGWRAVVPAASTDEDAHHDVVRVGAALELLHAFALVQDDVMDASATRRGRPAAHVLVADGHRAADAVGDADRFGEALAILLGDLAHTEADHLVGGLGDRVRAVWRTLCVELVCGQSADLVDTALGRRDLASARRVARMKSGAYTVERPLQLGAAVAGAPERISAALTAYGRSLGEAFALRDDLLGAVGDPVRTGKPAGDDLVAGKPTVILALAHRRLRGAAAVALARVGTPQLRVADVPDLQQALIDTGVVADVEAMITDHVAECVDALADVGLTDDGVRALTAIASRIAWRDR